MLFNEPKLLKYCDYACSIPRFGGFSALQRAEIAEILIVDGGRPIAACFSALQRAEIAEIQQQRRRRIRLIGFSALQRAEIAEMIETTRRFSADRNVSVLFNEPKLLKCRAGREEYRRCRNRFSALQRAEIAEIRQVRTNQQIVVQVSVLFNEPKLLKSHLMHHNAPVLSGFSALQRAEIAEIAREAAALASLWRFQCSSTSRNC